MIQMFDLCHSRSRLGKIFLGHDWLQAANPTIDWAAGWLTFRRKIPYSDLDPTQEGELMEEFRIG
jgi:hypothetical protein